MAVAAVECVDEAEAPMPRVSAYAPEKSHVIRLGEVSTKSENVAIPMIVFQNSKGTWGNCMRNWVWFRNVGSQGRVRGPGARGGVPVGARLPCPWAVAGPGRASRRRVELPNNDPAPQVWRAPEGPQGLVAVPVGGGRARAGLEIDHSEPQARVWRSRGRAAAHRHTQRPGLPRQALRRGRRAGGPPPTGTQSDQTELGRLCAVDGGRTEQPGLTQHAAHRTPEVPHSKQNSSNTTKNAHSNTSIHSFTATLTKVI